MIEMSIPVVFAIFIWWFSTGLVLLLNGMPRTTFRWSLLISSVLALAAFFGLMQSAKQSSVVNAYCAFTCALLIWGWHELTFLTGWLTGPRKRPCTASRGWPRFSQAFAAIMWHELAILASGILIIAVTWGAPNQVGTWTFLVLWAMRISAEFLPAHLAYMGSYFKRRAMNMFLPISVLAASAVLYILLVRASSAATSPAEAVGFLLVSTMLAMAILEHFLLVLPLPSTALWRWALRGRNRVATAAAD